MAFISNGTTILDAGAFNVNLGSLVLISEQTASSSASVSFTTGIDSTYPIYKFEFINCHASTDASEFEFNLSTDGGSNYNVTKTTTAFQSIHNESDTTTSLNYETAEDLAQSTSNQRISINIGADNDQSASGNLYLFNPSSTTFVKHFISRINYYHKDDYSVDWYVAGYGNTTSSINAIKFVMSSGNIDSGKIKLYGIKDS
jgi:VCBS repeat-containing protein